MTSSPTDHSFADLLDGALTTPLEGWDFSFLRGRMEHEPLPWDYRGQARDMVARARRVCDVDTGGGELLAGLRPPRGSVAVEPYVPNIAVATRRLTPLGVSVLARQDDSLPLDDEAFDLVLNTHGNLHPGETYRVLSPGGRLLTQQVGAGNDAEFNTALGVPTATHTNGYGSVDELADKLASAGFVVHEAREAWSTSRYLDIGAVIFQLRMVPWQAPGFDAEVHRPQLRRIHDQIRTEGGFEVRSQRFLAVARRPS